MPALTCIALAVYFEARSEPIAIQQMVADVVLNRVEDKRYPNDVCAVVWEPKQFSWTHDGKSDIPRNRKAWVTAQAVARDSVEREQRFQATHYLNQGVNRQWEHAFAYMGAFGAFDWYYNDTKYR